MTAPRLSDLLPLARAMTASLTAEDRTRRLVELVGEALPCDSVALLRLEGESLVPVCSLGLSDDVMGRRFRRSEHPRLDIICGAHDPTRFPADSPLPDPYDGLVIGEQVVLEGQVHSCLGCPLRVDGELVGVLTADALTPGAFDSISDDFLAHLAALAGATLRTNDLIETLHRRAELQGQVARELVADTRARRGGILVGTSDAMVRLRQEIELVAQSDFPVLVSGETGTGKEIVVRLLHAHSRRSAQPLVYVNCAALPESIAESELFGHLKGAFTGAEADRLGKFRVADGASLFLDEIGELSMQVQPKLLRVLQEGEIQCVGSDKIERVDVRILTATNRDLEAEVRAGRFRADLLHRLDVCRIEVPPLRERKDDIPPLAGHFADKSRGQLGTGPIRFAPGAQRVLVSSDWPGNVRELENSISRGALRAAARVERGEPVRIEAEDLDASAPAPTNETVGEPITAPGVTPRPLREAVEDFKRSMILRSVERHGGNWAAAARELQVERGNLHHMARRLGLK